MDRGASGDGHNWRSAREPWEEDDFVVEPDGESWEEDGEAEAEADETLLPSLETLSIGGDPLLVGKVEEWKKRCTFADPPRSLVNGESENGQGDLRKSCPPTPPPTPYCWSSDEFDDYDEMIMTTVQNYRKRQQRLQQLKMGSELEEAKKNEEDDWDPMAADYYSRQNVAGGDPDLDPKSFIFGEKPKHVKDKDFVCPFYKDPRKPYCYKGPRCQYKHVINPVEEDPQVTYPTASDLMKRTKLMPNFFLEVQVVHVKSPIDFYVVPVRGSECLCEPLATKYSELQMEFNVRDFSTYKSSSRARRAMTFDEFGKGMTAFNNIAVKLKDTLETNLFYKTVQIATYTENQLVAVRVIREVGDITEWYRGKVLKGNEKEFSIQHRELPWYQVELIDIGLKMEVRVDKMCPLPVSFTSYPPLALRCTLPGIVPVYMDWHSDVTTEFKRWVKKETLTMRVLGKRSKKQYPVDLLFPGDRLPEPATFQLSVSKHMADLGMCLMLNEFPYRPIANWLLSENSGKNNNLLAYCRKSAVPPTQKPPTESEHLQYMEKVLQLAQEEFGEKTVLQKPTIVEKRKSGSSGYNSQVEMIVND